MTLDQRVRAARAFWAEEQATDDQIQAVTLIAQQKKFRPKFVIELDDERRAKHLASLVALPETLAARALIVYHIAEQREMMGAFLDALDVKHENGIIQEDDAKPDSSRFASAADTIAARFPAEDVSLYLTTLVCQDPATWGELKTLTQVMQ